MKYIAYQCGLQPNLTNVMLHFVERCDYMILLLEIQECWEGGALFTVGQFVTLFL